VQISAWAIRTTPTGPRIASQRAGTRGPKRTSATAISTAGITEARSVGGSPGSEPVISSSAAAPAYIAAAV
jgi:hypothetical protein